MTVFKCCLIKLLPYILFEKNIYILALEMAGPGNQHCASCIDTLSFPVSQSTDLICRYKYLQEALSAIADGPRDAPLVKISSTAAQLSKQVVRQVVQQVVRQVVRQTHSKPKVLESFSFLFFFYLLKQQYTVRNEQDNKAK